jgi:hypothetical protein
MLEPHFERLRSEVGDAVHQREFITVRRRAGQVRRRRTVAAAAVFLATVLSVTGLGYAVHSGPHERGVSGPVPAVSGVPDDGWPRMTSVTNAGTDLYGVLVRCMTCGGQLYVSSDGGASWQRRTLPPGPGALTGAVFALAPHMVAWHEGGNVPVYGVFNPASPASDPSPATAETDPLWLTRDGGRTWRKAVVDTQPVATVPEGTRPVDCALLHISTCVVGVIDPATGRFAPLASQPTGITIRPGWASQITVPLDGHLWLPGLDPVTNMPAVATSSDAGRTWHTHVFTDAVAAVVDHGEVGVAYLPQLAAGSGETAYVLTYRADHVVDAHYTTDGGMTWRTGDTVHGVWWYTYISLAFVAADGSHIVATGTEINATGTGFVTARGTSQYTLATLPGYPVEPTQKVQITSAQATERYLVTSLTGPYLSKDGRTWRRVRLP